ncbi:MAG: carbamoyltransferase HypF [Promethearchaeota archaeon]
MILLRHYLRIAAVKGIVLFMKKARIVISGIVQGVGFRPFLFNLAKSHNLTGQIQNTGNLGVVLDLQAPHNSFNFKQFTQEIIRKSPQIAFIEEINIKNAIATNLIDYDKLTIASSETNAVGKSVTLPPDIAMCPSCLDDFNNIRLSRYYHYPFVACAQCGPRFTTMRSLPYDRTRSTMDEFPFCKGENSCNKEYNDFNNRRFHAQTFGCKNCGPFYFTVIPNTPLPKNPQQDNIDTVAKEILKGKIAAIKGIGGIFLVCLADDEKTIGRLRKRKRDRKNKPFAIMVPNLERALSYCEVDNPKLITHLTSFRRPIVLFPKRKNVLPENISPGLPNTGIILPYTGVHHLLFEKIDNRPVIYTSGNISSLPMAILNKDIVSQLKNIADIFYLHNREIYQRCDDSVMRPVLGNPNPIRRSRGYVPEYIKLPFKSPYKAMIGVGPELNSTGAVARGSRIFPTQHIGNVTNLETYKYLADAIQHMQTLLKVESREVGVIAHDLHPMFHSTRLAGDLAEKFGKETGTIPDIIPVQHHHAHLATLMLDHNIPPHEQIIAITIDGVGYGQDGQPWGGEILIGNYKSYRRISHLTPIPMVGGDLCAKFPGRMLLSALMSASDYESGLKLVQNLNSHLHLDKHFPQTQKEYNFIINKFTPKNRSYLKDFPQTSSFGRWLDAVASLFNLSQQRTYRGEPAMRLEGFIWDGIPESHFDLENYHLNGRILSGELLRDYASLYSTYIKNRNFKQGSQQCRDLAASMVHDISMLFGMQAVRISEKTGITMIGVSGGVAYNEKIMSVIKKVVEFNGLEFLQNKVIPSGDAGISTGQLAIAAARKN